MAATAAGGSKANVIVTAGVLTLLAAIGGGLVGKLVVARLKGATLPAPVATAAPLPYPTTLEVRELDPIITNLASPSEARIRLQAAIVYTKGSIEEPGAAAAQITDDILAFLKTLSLPRLEGASGLQALREDLADRAAVRTQGKVREVIIETLVLQ